MNTDYEFMWKELRRSIVKAVLEGKAKRYDSVSEHVNYAQYKIYERVLLAMRKLEEQ